MTPPAGDHILLAIVVTLTATLASLLFSGDIKSTVPVTVFAACAGIVASLGQALADRFRFGRGWLWTLAAVVGLGLPALLWHLVRNVPDRGGLATAALLVILIGTGLALAGIAVLWTLLGRFASPVARSAWLRRTAATLAILVAAAAGLGWYRQRVMDREARAHRAEEEAAAAAARPAAPSPRPRPRAPAPRPSAAIEFRECPDELPPLFHAIEARDLPRVRALVRAGANVNLHCHLGEGSHLSPLEAAIHARAWDIAAFLLDHGADTGPSTNSTPPLAEATAAGETDLVRRLLSAGADPGIRSSGVPVLYDAAAQGHSGIVRLLLDAGADPGVGYYGKTPLEAARENGHHDTAREFERVTEPAPASSTAP